ALPRLAVHAGRERAALDGALRRVATLALEVELGALAAAEAADRAAVVGHALNPPPLGWAAPVVRDRGHVGDRADLQTGGLQRADRRRPACAGPTDEHLDRAHAVLERLLGGRFGGRLRGERRRLAAALEALRARGAPGDDVAVDVADRDDRVVERALDVGLPRDHVLALAAPRPHDLFRLTHLSSWPLLACLDLLLACDRALRTAPAARVGACALAAHGQAAAVAHAAVGADLRQALDVQRDLAAEVTFDQDVLRAREAVDDLAQAAHLFLAEVFGALARVDVRVLHDLPGRGVADAVDVRQGDDHALLWGYVDAGDSRHL